MPRHSPGSATSMYSHPDRTHLLACPHTQNQLTSHVLTPRPSSPNNMYSHPNSAHLFCTYNQARLTFSELCSFSHTLCFSCWRVFTAAMATWMTALWAESACGLLLCQHKDNIKTKSFISFTEPDKEKSSSFGHLTGSLQVSFCSRRPCHSNQT